MRWTRCISSAFVLQGAPISFLKSKSESAIWMCMNSQLDRVRTHEFDMLHGYTSSCILTWESDVILRCRVLSQVAPQWCTEHCASRFSHGTSRFQTCMRPFEEYWTRVKFAHVQRTTIGIPTQIMSPTTFLIFTTRSYVSLNTVYVEGSGECVPRRLHTLSISKLKEVEHT